MQYPREELFKSRSDRVKGVDLHPTEPWILVTLYNGFAQIYSYETNALIKEFELSIKSVRAGRFIARNSWIVAGSDDHYVRVYNYNTSEKVAEFEAHEDYIRAVIVHPTKDFILTAADDMKIKRWGWHQSGGSWEWVPQMTYTGHTNYVMSLAFNPKDTEKFASAALDNTIKFWRWEVPKPDYSIKLRSGDVAHTGYNHVDYYPHGDNPYLLTASDDNTVKIVDFKEKALVHTLGTENGQKGATEGHTNNVSFACYHPELPLIISGSEDNTIKIWSSVTYTLLETINVEHDLGRAWSVGYRPGRSTIAMGFDFGSLVYQIGSEAPAYAFHNGRLIWYSKEELHSALLDSKANAEVQDGQRIYLTAGKTEECFIHPKSLSSIPGSRYFAICGKQEYSVHTIMSLKQYQRASIGGPAEEFVWGDNTKTNVFAIRTPTSTQSGQGSGSAGVYIVRNFDGNRSEQLPSQYRTSSLTGGTFLGLKSFDSIDFLDWQTKAVISTKPLSINNVYWSESGKYVALTAKNQFTMFYLSDAEYSRNIEAGEYHEDALKEVTTVGGDDDATEGDDIISGKWAEDFFFYTTSTNQLRYCVCAEETMHVQTVAHFDKPLYVLGYLSDRDGRAYLTDKDFNITSYAISSSLIRFQKFYLRRDDNETESIIDEVRKEGAKSDEAKAKADKQLDAIAFFLEKKQDKEGALRVAADQVYRFDLAVQTKDFDVAAELAKQADQAAQWKIVGDMAMTRFKFDFAETCFSRSKDLDSLLLLHTSTGNLAGLAELAKKADAQAAYNIEFTALFSLGDVDGCIDLLVRTNRLSEAVMFARTYKPSRCRDIALQWKKGLEKAGSGKISKMLAIPPASDGTEEEDVEFFPDWDDNLAKEKEGATNGLESDFQNGVPEQEEAGSGVDGTEDENGTVDGTKATV